MTYPTLAPYGWGDRWEALFVEAAGSPAPAASGPSTPASDASGGPSGDAGDAGGTSGARAAVPGRVLRHDGVAVSVALPDGVVNRPLRRGLDPAPVVGDWVVERDGTLDAVLPRRSLLERMSVRRDQPQSLAANVDLVLVVCGLDRPVKAGRIQRTATLAWDTGAVPAVVLTKADALSEDAVAAIVREVRDENPGLDVIVTSSDKGVGIDALRALVDGNTVVLVGESGAGKSSLVNSLLEDPEAARVGRVRHGDQKGRHTTTNRQLHVVPGGGVVIDTPGIRTVGLWADTEAVTTTFDDIDELGTQCRFANCEHDTEPGCAVLAAVEAGTLSADRLASWRSLEREAAATERRADPRATRQWGKAYSRVGKEAQRRKGRS